MRAVRNVRSLPFLNEDSPDQDSEVGQAPPKHPRQTDAQTCWHHFLMRSPSCSPLGLAQALQMQHFTAKKFTQVAFPF